MKPSQFQPEMNNLTQPTIQSRFPDEDITNMLEYVMGRKRTPAECEDDVIPDTRELKNYLHSYMEICFLFFWC